MTEKQETWPEVWARYWNPMEDDQVHQWDEEFGNIFGRRPADGSVKVDESEICTALRALGVEEKYQSFKPKIGSVIDHIKQARRKEIEEVMGQEASRRHGTVGCLYCRDKAWVTVPYVRTAKGWRFPKPEVWKGDHPTVPNVKIEMLDLEPHTDQVLPCLLCGKGDKFIEKNGLDRGKVHSILESYKKWVLLLPNECVRKPDLLRGKTDTPLVKYDGMDQPPEPVAPEQKPHGVEVEEFKAPEPVSAMATEEVW